jgi:hypothetical protein
MSTDKRLKPTVDLGYPTEPHGPIPAFQSIEEEAEFWDTHDFTDFSELTEEDFDEDIAHVEPAASTQLSEDFPVRLAPADREELGRRAEKMGLEPAELARMWIEEHLKKEAS